MSDTLTCRKRRLPQTQPSAGMDEDAQPWFAQQTVWKSMLREKLTGMVGVAAPAKTQVRTNKPAQINLRHQKRRKMNDSSADVTCGQQTTPTIDPKPSAKTSTATCSVATLDAAAMARLYPPSSATFPTKPSSPKIAHPSPRRVVPVPAYFAPGVPIENSFNNMLPYPPPFICYPNPQAFGVPSMPPSYLYAPTSPYACAAPQQLSLQSPSSALLSSKCKIAATKSKPTTSNENPKNVNTHDVVIKGQQQAEDEVEEEEPEAARPAVEWEVAQVMNELAAERMSPPVNNRMSIAAILN